MDAVVTASWRPEGEWLTLFFVVVGCAAVISGLAIALVGRPKGRLATGVMLGYLIFAGAAAAARINLAIDRGRDDLDMAAIIIAFGLATAAALVVIPAVVRASASSTKRTTMGGVLTVTSVAMLVVAVFTNLESPS
jgi:hypothetical protein